MMSQAVKLIACTLEVAGSNLGEILTILVDIVTSRSDYRRGLDW
jgi:hypothetical protein